MSYTPPRSGCDGVKLTRTFLKHMEEGLFEERNRVAGWLKQAEGPFTGSPPASHDCSASPHKAVQSLQCSAGRDVAWSTSSDGSANFSAISDLNQSVAAGNQHPPRIRVEI
jgi:hypothetical protein